MEYFNLNLSPNLYIMPTKNIIWLGKRITFVSLQHKIKIPNILKYHKIFTARLKWEYGDIIFYLDSRLVITFPLFKKKMTSHFLLTTKLVVKLSSQT